MSVKHVEIKGVPVSLTDGWVFTGNITGEGSAAEQIAGCAEKLGAIIEQCGLSRNSAVKCTVVIKDYEMKESVIQALESLLGDSLPAMSFLEEAESTTSSLVSLDVILSGDAEPQRFYNGEKYPCAVKAGDFVYISAQTAGSRIENLEEETELTLGKLTAALNQAGCTVKQVVKNQVFIQDCSQFDRFNKAFVRVFEKTDNSPARSLLGITGLGTDGSVAAEAIAYTGDARRTFVCPDAPYSATAPYCQAIQAGHMVFVSGQVGRDVVRNIICSPLEEECRQTIKNVTSILAYRGVVAENYIKTNSFLREAKNNAAFNSMIEDALGYAGTNIFYTVSGLARPTLAVEMDAVAYID